MSRGGFRRAKPRISFALASLFIILALALLSGGVEIKLRLSNVAHNPQALLVGGIFAAMAILLLYEW